MSPMAPHTSQAGHGHAHGHGHVHGHGSARPGGVTAKESVALTGHVTRLSVALASALVVAKGAAWIASGSVMIVPTVMRGLSELHGSWNTACTLAWNRARPACISLAKWWM